MSTAHVSTEEAGGGSRGLLPQLKDWLRPFEPYFPKLTPVLSWRRAFKVLDHYRFRPVTVFDIGVGFGTYELYHAYPQAFYYLVDPTPESLPHMHRIGRNLKCEILNVALGDQDAEVMLEVRSDIQGSTLFEEYGTRGVLRQQKVPLRRFDTVIGAFQRPALCKIDVQGAEMLVLNGMGNRIADIDIFIIEASTIATVKGGPEMHDVIHFMKEQGFAPFDIIGMKRRPLDGATAQVDIVFAAESSYLRADRRWAPTPRPASS